MRHSVRHLLLLASAIVMGLSFSSAALAYDALSGPTELRYWDSTRAYNGYTFFGAMGTSYLIDMQGRVVHTWPIGANPHLLENGHILDAAKDDPSGFGGFTEVDWDGNIVWQYTEARSTYHPHHDFMRIYNPKLGAYTTLYIANKDLTSAELIAAGADPARVPSTGAQMDAIVEVDASGTVVWEWCFFDHMIQDFDAAKPNYAGSGKTIADYPGRLNINLPGHNLKGDWLHCNSLDYNQALDQIVTNSVQGEFYVIDHGSTFTAGNPTASIAAAATSAGDFLYRFGDPARYSQGATPAVLEDWTQSTHGNKQLGGAHDINWIAAGLPGAGHFMIFNNAQYLSEHTPQSTAIEINPYLDASGTDTGHYVNPPDAGYTTVTYPESKDRAPKQVSKQIVWSYESKSNLTLFSTIGCSAQRLPNGNTLVCADTYGYISEVTPGGGAVWEYIVPVSKNGILLETGDKLPMVISIFRAYRYAASYPAFTGRTLILGNTIAGRSAVDNPYAGKSYQALQRPTELQYWDSANAANGYTLFAAQGNTYLIDMEGRVVHQWALGTNPRLLGNGNLLDSATNSSGQAGFQEVDWNGNVVWEYYETRAGYYPHSDFLRIFDSELNASATLYLAAKDLTHAQCIAAGCDPANGPYDGAQADAIVEVDMSGNVIWEWCFFDHGIQSIDAAKSNYVGSGRTIADFPGRLNLNLPGRLVREGWPDCNSLDYNQALNHIVVNTEPGEFYIIDHGATFTAGNPTASIAAAASSAGDFLYRFGDPARYSQGSAPSVSTNWENASNGNKQIGPSNNARWIAPGLPGAGHLLVFSNNQYLIQRTPQSYVFEINPYLNSAGTDTGAYVNPPTAGYSTWTFDKDTMKANQLLSKQVTWNYGTLNSLSLFSHFGSSAQRLANGNTLICATTAGYLLEVTSAGKVAWEYINPITTAGVVDAIGDCLPMTNAVPKAHRYAATFAGFANRDMTAGDTITAAAAKAWSMAALPDTGQTQSATSTFGEDADYTIHPPSLTANTDGTVNDNVTGLMWQKTDGGEMTWDAATTYSMNLSLGGYQDWRLPTAHELYSILNHGTINPALDTTAFATSAAEYWWSRDTMAGDATRVWSANAGGGIGPHPKSETISAGGIKRFHARCVRGAAAPAAVAPIHHYKDNNDGTVTDLDTGLMWQKGEASASMTWESALACADGLGLAGYSDWRLPNVKELQSLNDETMTAPALDLEHFPGAAAAGYWSSTSMINNSAQAWTDDFQLGIVSYSPKTALLWTRCVRTASAASSSAAYVPEYARIPGGTYVMGGHDGFIDPAHPTDELPLHSVTLDPFYIGKSDVTCGEYRDYLNAALAQGIIEVRSDYVYADGGTEILSDTCAADPTSRIQYASGVFSVRDNRDLHPVTGIRWFGAIAYCNWLSARDGYDACYNLTTGVCDFAKNGYRLPTEAEWEYAARGGLKSPYRMFPWGDDTNSDGRLANWPGSGDPYEGGGDPATTPARFYNGELHSKADFGWPGAAETYQTRNSINGYGLYDMSGNVWQWTNDFYGKEYYQYCVDHSVMSNPTGPSTGDLMPDGLPYHILRGGNWFNGQDMYGHGRAANRDPGYYRGLGDPNGPWYHVGFRVARGGASPVAAGATLQQIGDGYIFTEGPAADASGNVFFSDVEASIIYKWSAMNGAITTFRTNSGGANGLYFDASGSLLACESGNKRLTSITPAGVATVLTATYNSAAYNKPNDLWIYPSGGVYFSDPLFGAGTQTQDGEHVYYLAPGASAATRVIADMTRPNGLIGTPDGKTLYAADYGASKVYKYTINSNGTLTGKTLFASVQCDGMTLDSEGNIYMASDAVLIFSPAGNQIGRIEIPETPTNLTFGGADGSTLFITARTAIYTIHLSTNRAEAEAVVSTPPAISGTTRSPSAPTSTDAVWINANITDDGSIASANLTYSDGSSGGGSGTETTVFQETFCTTAAKPWTGTGAEHTWTVTGGASVEQRTGANYGTGNACGVEFHKGTIDLTGTMITTVDSINAAGASGYVEFWLQSIGLSGTAGWTFQIDAGSGYQTRLSELTGSNHAWQQFHYALQTSELVNGIKLRFQFRGGIADERVDMDQIIIKVTSGGSSSTTIPMLDDGAHNDGAAGDHVYGAQIPAAAAGSTVHYYIVATDNTANQTSDPAGAPANTYSYTVSSPAVTQTMGLFTNLPGAFQGYTLLAPMHYTRTYLLNNAGQVCHKWDSAYEPGRTAYLLENGHLIRACMTKSGGPSTGGGEGGRIEEFDWDGNMVWELDFYSDNYIAHHDFKVLPNGNIIVLVAEKKTYAEVIAAGFNPSLLDPQITTSGYMLPDYVAEIQPAKPSGGTVVWEWHAWDHLVQDFDASKSNYGVVASHPELIDPNGTGIKIPQFWNHMNTISYNADLDQIMLSCRGNSEAWIIDHQTTTAQAASHTGGRYNKGGDLLYRWGNPQQYNTGTPANQMLLQQHDTEWIPSGRPGAGDILIFNNGIGRGYSTIDQITPPVDSAGAYSRTAGAAFGPSTLTWTYKAPTPADFYSAEISGAQRLSNGNTLICEGLKGNLFEVTSSGQTVWRYLCPVAESGPLTQGAEIPADPRGGFMNAVFQADRYAADFAGLVGKDLTPGDPVEINPLPSPTPTATPIGAGVSGFMLY